MPLVLALCVSCSGVAVIVPVAAVLVPVAEGGIPFMTPTTNRRSDDSPQRPSSTETRETKSQKRTTTITTRCNDSFLEHGLSFHHADHL